MTALKHEITKLLNIYKKYIFESAINRTQNLILHQNKPDRKLIKKLFYGFGNEGYSAKPEFLETCIYYASKTNGTILECGSGLTTIVIGMIAQSKTNKMITLEHKEEWAETVSKYLSEFQIDCIDLQCKPLKKYGEFDWYDPDLQSIKKSIGLIICDGPPSKTIGGRFGLVPVLKNHLKKDTIILMDDTIRKEELDIIEKWKNMIEIEVIHKGDNVPHAVLKITN